MSREEISVRQWQEQFRAGAFDSRDLHTQCRAGWYDWFCQDNALAGRLKKIAKVHISFDKAAVERQGRRMEDVHRTVKTLFAVHDFPCTDDNDGLVFEDRGHGDDFAVMWDIIMSLLRAEWFLDCASSCVWQDENGEEDVLAQAGKVCEEQ